MILLANSKLAQGMPWMRPVVGGACPKLGKYLETLGSRASRDIFQSSSRPNALQ